MVAEKRILVTAYTVMHQTHTLRPIESQSMNRAFIISIAPLREQELAYSNPQAIDKSLKDTFMYKWFD